MIGTALVVRRGADAPSFLVCTGRRGETAEEQDLGRDDDDLELDDDDFEASAVSTRCVVADGASIAAAIIAETSRSNSAVVHRSRLAGIAGVNSASSKVAMNASRSFRGSR